MVPSSIVQVIDEHDEFDHYLINPKHSSSKSILVAEVEVEEDGDHHQEDTVQQHPNHLSNGLCWDDVIIEKFLGVGGFNCVSLARIPKWEKENDDDNDGNKENDIEMQNGPVTLSKATTSSRLVGTTTTTATSPQKYYAIKCLKNSIAYNQHDSTKKKEKYVQGLKDLINEGRLLSQLQHPHILQCHGTGSGASATAGGYFFAHTRARDQGRHPAGGLTFPAFAGLQDFKTPYCDPGQNPGYQLFPEPGSFCGRCRGLRPVFDPAF